MRYTKEFTVSDISQLKSKLLAWSAGEPYVVWLDSNQRLDSRSKFDAVLALGCKAKIACTTPGALDALDTFLKAQKDWMFGYLGYDLKNEIEDLESNNPDGLQFPDLYFVVPHKLFFLNGNGCQLAYSQEVSDQLQEDWEAINAFNNEVKDSKASSSAPIKIRLRTSKDSYFERFGKIQWHLQRGDIYETNYCQEFFSEDTEIAPLECFYKLNALAEAPFSSYLRFEEQYIISSSPERYLQKQGSKVISQPIKGTAKRGSSRMEDLQLQQQLVQNPKERSENIMITDLVRNDLSHLAQPGSVTVEALCELHSFKQVHQLISTVSAEVSEGVTAVDLIRATFPMGSMTGAPKVRAMTIAEKLEDFKRGVYSGAVGYFSPDGDFDFNVVIRSILYNSSLNYVSFAVGGAITAAANANDEYEECLLKAKAMRQVLEENS